MKQNLTYEQLLNLNSEDFSNRKDKSLQELLLYIYHFQKKHGDCEYEITLNEIYKACIDMDALAISIMYAFKELIKNSACKNCIEYLTDYLQAFLQECSSIDNPVKHWGNKETTINAYYDLVSFFLQVLEELESWGYDLSKLMLPCK